MKAAVFYGKDDLRIEEPALPAFAAAEAFLWEGGGFAEGKDGGSARDSSLKLSLLHAPPLPLFR